MSDSPSEKSAMALDYAKSSLDNQFARVNQIQTSLGVLLGFVVASIGLIFSSGKTWNGSSLWIDGSALGLLLVAAAIFGFGLAVFRLHRDSEDITTTLGLDNLTISVDEARRRLIARYLRYYRENQRAIHQRFLLVNVGIGALLAGVFLFALGNLPY